MNEVVACHERGHARGCPCACGGEVEMLCPVCQRRAADTTAVINGGRIELCSTCCQRRDRELEGSWA